MEKEEILKDSPEYEDYTVNVVKLSHNDLKELGYSKCGGCCSKKGGCTTAKGCCKNK